MRGFGGRSGGARGRDAAMAMATAQPAIRSYTEALYPPRPYRYHLQLDAASTTATQGGSSDMTCMPVVLPSIDADSICEPARGRGAAGTLAATGSAAAASSSSTRVPPPVLRAYMDCFVPDTSGGECASYAATLAHSEPLNALHYPQLFDNSSDGRAVRQRIADMLALPHELRTFASAGGDGVLMVPCAALRVRTHARARAPRPLRRGAKVTLPSSTTAAASAVQRGGGARKRERDEDGDEDDDDDKARRRLRGDDAAAATVTAADDLGDHLVDDADDDEDDELSVNMSNGDNDDANDDDFDAGSDGGGDDYM